MVFVPSCPFDRAQGMLCGKYKAVSHVQWIARA